MTSRDRSQCIFFSKYPDFYFRLTVGERQPLSLPIRLRSINCDLTLVCNHILFYMYFYNKCSRKVLRVVRY